MLGQDLSSEFAGFTQQDTIQEEQIQVCKLYANIVGKRFYNHPLFDGEIIYLVREPHNPYDGNAIKVVTRNQIQVGHISAGSSYPNMAACLSIIVDGKLAGGAMGSLEAVSVAGQSHTFTSVCEITIVSVSAHRDAILQHLKRCNIGFLDLRDMTVSGQFNDLRRRNSVKLADLASSSSASSSLSQPTAVYTQISQEDVLKSLDDMWDMQESELEDISSKFNIHGYSLMASYFKTHLYQHQQQGLAWMLDRELVKSKGLPPFYEEIEADSAKPDTSHKGSITSFFGKKGQTSSTSATSLKRQFKHSLTNHVYDSVPASITGGVVADLMGMGKSAMILALILCNPDPSSSSIESLPTLEPQVDEVVFVGKGKASSKRKAGIESAAASSKKVKKLNPLTGSAVDSPSLLNSTKATLIVCPLSVVSSWVAEISRHYSKVRFVEHESAASADELNVVIYHGPDREMNLTIDSLRAIDIVVTTYDVIASEYIEDSSGKGGISSVIGQVRWWRAVLDESHTIRNLSTRRFKGCDSISSVSRWCVTGTLIVNSIADIEAPLKFLKLEPFFGDSELFKRLISRPIKRGDIETLLKVRTLMKTISIRRDKNKLVECRLPEKQEFIVSVLLSSNERKVYDDISRTVATYANKDSALSSQSVLTLIMRLRQLCLDLRLVPANILTDLMSRLSETSISNEEKAEFCAKFRELLEVAVGGPLSSNEALSEKAAESVVECAICFEPLFADNCIIFRNCKHILCQDCTQHLFKKSDAGAAVCVPCPLCRTSNTLRDVLTYTDLETTDDQSSTTSFIMQSAFRSSKTNEILACLKRIRDDDPSQKVVIFSSFVMYLDILQKLLEEEGISYCRISGSCSQKTRQSQIKIFNEDDVTQVMLCSLKACGVGITLTRANNIFLTDLWWAPSIDQQAIDRVHRLGQNRVVKVFRFIVKDSIDEKIFALQRKKAEISRAAMDKGEHGSSSQRLDDLRSLLLS